MIDRLSEQLRAEASARSPRAARRAIPGDAWGVDTELGRLLERAADEIESVQYENWHLRQSFKAAREEVEDLKRKSLKVHRAYLDAKRHECKGPPSDVAPFCSRCGGQL